MEQARFQIYTIVWRPNGSTVWSWLNQYFYLSCLCWVVESRSEFVLINLRIPISRSLIKCGWPPNCRLATQVQEKKRKIWATKILITYTKGPQHLFPQNYAFLCMQCLLIPPKSQECSFAWGNTELEFLHLNLKSRNSYKNRKNYMSENVLLPAWLQCFSDLVGSCLDPVPNHSGKNVCKNIQLLLIWFLLHIVFCIVCKWSSISNCCCHNSHLLGLCSFFLFASQSSVL